MRNVSMSSKNTAIAALMLVVGSAAASGLAQTSAPARPAGAATTAPPSRPLRPVSAFARVADPAKRSVALFEEAGKVILHPRCVNCHPAGDRPTQGTDGQPHQPWVRRGADGNGAVGMRCGACHQTANFDPAGVPGHPKWHLAPIEMAWQGKTLGQICRQIKDPGRNGGHSLAEIVTHMADDSLVGWAWSPGGGREPAPGTQATFGALVRAWAESGAACPTS
jgi:hypothetical protein